MWPGFTGCTKREHRHYSDSTDVTRCGRGISGPVASNGVVHVRIYNTAELKSLFFNTGFNSLVASKSDISSRNLSSLWSKIWLVISIEKIFLNVLNSKTNYSYYRTTCVDFLLSRYRFTIHRRRGYKNEKDIFFDVFLMQTLSHWTKSLWLHCLSRYFIFRYVGLLDTYWL